MIMTNANDAPITDIELDALLLLGMNASQGQWNYDSFQGYSWLKNQDGDNIIYASGADECDWGCSDADGRFIAATNPVTVRRLVAALRDARAERDGWKELYDKLSLQHTQDRDWSNSLIAMAKKEREVKIEQLETLNARYIAMMLAGGILRKIDEDEASEERFIGYYWFYQEQGDVSEPFDTPEQALADFERNIMGKE